MLITIYPLCEPKRCHVLVTVLLLSDDMTAVPDLSNFAPRESAATVRLEEAYLVIALFMAISYGAVVTLSIQCITVLARDAKASRRNSFLLWFVVAIFAVSTVFLAAGVKYILLGFVDERNYPGGPTAFLVTQGFRPANVLANVCVILSTSMSDALLVSAVAGIHV